MTRIAIQMDPLEKLNHASDSTLYLAATALKRGYDLFHYEPQALRMDLTGTETRITARGHKLNYTNNVWSLGAPEIRELKSFDVILVRQDPPFDLAYITATHMLEHLRTTVKIINDPIGIRNAPEKLLSTYFPQLMPPTLIARDIDAIEKFRAEHRDIIIKPVHGFAGHGIFHLRENDDNLAALLEATGANNREPWMIQKYLPVQKYGDKRIVLIDAEPVGCFTRMPSNGDARSNLRVGGKAVASPLTARDKEICTIIAPTLRQHGLFLCGIDVIGDYLTEINVTSPTGLVTADQLENRTSPNTIPEQFWNRVLNQ